MRISPPRSLTALCWFSALGRGGLFCALLLNFLSCALFPCTALAAASASPGPSASTDTTAHATVSLPFGGLVPRESALSIARAAAYLEALHTATLGLEQHRAALFGAASTLRREALASAVHRPAVSVSPTKGVQPPAGEVTVEVRLSTPPRTVDARLRESLPLHDMLDMRELALLQMRASVEEGMELVHSAAERRKTLGSEGDRVYEHRVIYLGKRLEALWICEEALTRLRTLWSEPVPTARQLRKATQLDPRNPLLWAALGEVLLQMDQPQNALTCLNTALRQEPDLARALHARGLAHLRLQQSALAEADISAALRFRPEHAGWLRSRGAVRMVREDFEGMCTDFEQTCALGDCDGLVAARKRGLCLPPEKPIEPPTPPATGAAPHKTRP